MCSEIDSFSSFLRRNMSDSNNPRFASVRDEEDKEKIIDPVNPPQPRPGNTDSSAEIPPEIETTPSSQAEEKVEETTKEEETDKATASSRESREKQIIAEDDDGFKTPTSSEHKIPPMTDCPPAPKKARPQPSTLKRKASSPPQVRRSVEMDAPTEVESIFRPMSSGDNAEDDQQKSKKARNEDEEGDRSQ